MVTSNNPVTIGLISNHGKYMPFLNSVKIESRSAYCRLFDASLLVDGAFESLKDEKIFLSHSFFYGVITWNGYCPRDCI